MTTKITKKVRALEHARKASTRRDNQIAAANKLLTDAIDQARADCTWPEIAEGIRWGWDTDDDGQLVRPEGWTARKAANALQGWHQRHTAT